jgi:alpha-N-arabinofuranosidase
MKMMSGRTLILTLILFFPGLVTMTQTKVEINYQPLIPQVLLPDGTPFAGWDDITRYSRTYHVSRNNPGASDENEGTDEHPFLTISHAAQVVKPGERVCIHSGIYRELVRPRFSGEGPDRMIAYEAAPGEQVIISGSREVKTKWVLSVDPNDSANVARQKSSKEVLSAGNIFSKDIWMTTLPDDLFENGYFPLRIPNTTEEEFKLMDWATRWIGRPPYSLSRCLLFQEGRRMSQLSEYEDLVRLPGSCWVAPDGKTIHIHAFGKANPNSQFFEIGVQEHIIQPHSIGLGFIRVSGLILEHCANGFLRSGVGALFTMGGHHWIIEGNTVRHMNSLGIEIGSSAYERRDPRNPRTLERQEQQAPQVMNLNRGHHIVRQNNVSHCGTAGIRGLGVEYSLVEKNDIFDCGWQDAEFHYEVAGIKLLINRGTLVRNNYISHIQGGCGIWLDWDNRNSRVTRNVVYDITTAQGGIFIEASQVPNLVDNNILWNINGEGIYLCDTDNAIVVHNILGNVSEEQVVAKVKTDRSLGGRSLTSTGNQIVNNIFVNQGKPILSEDPGNITDYNVYIATLTGKKTIKDPGVHSVAIQGDITFDGVSLLLFRESGSRLPVVPLLKNCESDFFNIERTKNQNIAGPFQGMVNPVTLKLFDGPELQRHEFNRAIIKNKIF